MEYLDVLDENGNLTGEKKTREEVHRDGSWHRGVYVWIRNSRGELLMQKRTETKESYPGQWDISCAGHVPAGLTTIETAIIELHEELGLEVKEPELQKMFSFTDKESLFGGKFLNNEILDVFLLERDLELSDLRLQASEVSEVKWVTEEELGQIIVEEPAGYIPNWHIYSHTLNLLSTWKKH